MTPAAGAMPRTPPLVIGHRGAPAYRPEHTLASYALSIELGADYVEPDLVSTSDHVLVARHENDITHTTDVAEHPEFAARKTTKRIDGVTRTGWFTEDFTLAELDTLRAKERIPETRPANCAFDGRFGIPTFEQVIDLAERHGVGIYPETKHPTYFRSIGLPLEAPLIRALDDSGLNRAGAKVFVQSFEVSNLRWLRARLDVPLIQLIGARGAPADLVARGDGTTYADLATRRGLEQIATYAQGVGPAKTRILPVEPTSNALKAPTSLVADAHDLGLVVHAYTFRPENQFLPADFQTGDPSRPDRLRAHGDGHGELRRHLRLGVDGVFADAVDAARAVRDEVSGARASDLQSGPRPT